MNSGIITGKSRKKVVRYIDGNGRNFAKTSIHRVSRDSSSNKLYYYVNLHYYFGDTVCISDLNNVGLTKPTIEDAITNSHKVIRYYSMIDNKVPQNTYAHIENS